MLAQINADCSERFEIQLLNILRRGFQDHLQLGVLIKTIGIFTVAAIRRPARGLHVCDFVGLRTEYSQKCFGSHCARADFDVMRLLQDASPFSPESLQAKDEFLESQRIGGCDQSQPAVKG